MNPDDLILYVITDQKWLGENTLEEDVEAALKGGATIIQLREKNLTEDEVLKVALKLKPICARYKVPLIINDFVEVALKADADGVHVGQSDTGALEARAQLSADKILGVSCKTVAEALRAQEQGADYLGVGAVFHTDTKTDAEMVSLATLKEIISRVKIPVVAIGGISGENIPELEGKGISGVAVVSAVFAAKDIEMATQALKEKVLGIL